MTLHRTLRTSTLAALLTVVLSLSGCAALMSSVTNSLAEDLATTILNSDDPDTVRAGIPAYIIMVDSFLKSDPSNTSLLLAASSLNGAFTVFTEGEQQKRLATKALNYAFAAACSKRGFCALRTDPFIEFEEQINRIEAEDVPVFYAVGVAWTGWLQAHSDDWAAIAQLDRAKRVMTRVVELDERFSDGAGHLYLGGMETLLPASMGGRPEQGREHFERAIELAGGKYLMTKVIYAEQYARLVFDKALHDKLLREVLEAEPVAPNMTLTNVLAQQRAAVLLAESDEYF